MADRQLRTHWMLLYSIVGIVNYLIILLTLGLYRPNWQLALALQMASWAHRGWNIYTNVR